jgi:hypothetical protein
MIALCMKINYNSSVRGFEVGWTHFAYAALLFDESKI